MRALWWAVLADFRREYRLTAWEVGELPAWEFDTLLAGLSPEAVFRHAERDRPKVAATPADVAAITARGMR